MPHELRKIIADFLVTKNTQLGSGEYQLLLDWCVTAVQVDRNGDSVLAFEIKAIITEDAAFHTWTRLRLDGTMGHRPKNNFPSPTVPLSPMSDPAAFMANMSALMASELGKGLAKGMKSARSNHGGVSKSSEEGKKYSEDSIAA